MKKVFIILFFTLFLSACSAKLTPQPEIITTTFLPGVTSSPTPLLIATSTATSTALPTVQPIFKAGPESMVEGQYNQLHWDKLQSELDQLLPVLEQYMKDQGITADKVATAQMEMFQSHYFPYNMVDFYIPTNQVLGYSTLEMPDGTEMLIMHVPVRGPNNPEDIVILNIAVEEAPQFWQQRLQQGIDKAGVYAARFEPHQQFDLLATDPTKYPLMQVRIFVNIPVDGGSQWMDDFPETKYIFDNEIPDNMPSGFSPNRAGNILNTYMYGGSDPNELKAFIDTLEHQIMPSPITHYDFLGQ